MVGKFVKCWLREKDDKKILCVKLIDDKGFEKVAFLKESKDLNLEAMLDALLDLAIGTPICVDVNIIPDIRTGERRYIYRNIYFAGVKIC